jgi:hypothetical protein
MMDFVRETFVKLRTKARKLGSPKTYQDKRSDEFLPAALFLSASFSVPSRL